jgi:hypothetical protein
MLKRSKPLSDGGASSPSVSSSLAWISSDLRVVGVERPHTAGQGTNTIGRIRHSAVVGARKARTQPSEPERATEFGEGLDGQVLADWVGPRGQICGGELGVPQAHAWVLEQQPSKPPDRSPLVPLGLLLDEEPTDHQGPSSSGGGAGRLATAERTPIRLPRSRDLRKIAYGEPCDVIFSRTDVPSRFGWR